MGSTALFTEAERVVRYGFTATELDREKLDSQRYLDQALLEKDKSPSGPLADELVRHVVQDEPVPGIVYEQAMSQRFLPEITLAEINALARSWIPEGNRVVSVSAPERAGLALPTPASLAAVIATASKATLSAYVDRVNAQPLLATLPTPGTVVRASTREAIGVTEWQLSNGASRHSQADDLQGGRDSVPRGQPWRDVARERSGSGRRANGRAGRRRRRAGAVLDVST